MSQVAANYDSLLYPKHASNTATILPEVKDNSLATHTSQFHSKAVGGANKKRFTSKKGTIIRRKVRHARKTNRRKKSSRRYK